MLLFVCGENNKNEIIETYCLRHCCQDNTPKCAAHAGGGAVSINTKVKSEDTEITDTRNHRHILLMICKYVRIELACTATTYL